MASRPAPERQTSDRQTSDPVRKVIGAATAAAGVGAMALRRQLNRGDSTGGAEKHNPREPASGWHAVSVNRPPDEVMPGGTPPGPLADLGPAVQVEVRPAPGGRGTELRARPSDAAADGSVDTQRIREALREAKQLVEVGEVLKVDPVPHGSRGHGPGGKLIDAATRSAGGGVL